MDINIRHWQDDWPDFTFKKLVCMYINDCMQYLKATENGGVIEMNTDQFEATENEDLIYYGLRKLKDLCIEASGNEPLNWEDTP